MEADLTVLWTAVALFVLAGFVGMAVLPGWLRTRRREAVRRQIVLTDALDGRLGPIVSPDSIHEPRETRARRTAGRWAGHPVAAA
jgi:hypothetical protein